VLYRDDIERFLAYVYREMCRNEDVSRRREDPTTLQLSLNGSSFLTPDSVAHRAYEAVALSGTGEESEKVKGKRPAVEIEVMEDFEETPKRLGETIPVFTPMASTSIHFVTPHLQKQIASYAQYSPSPGHTYVPPGTRTPAVAVPRKSGYVTTPLSEVY
jgi:hypothetical protein